MRAVPQESVVDRHQDHRLSLCGARLKDFVVALVDLQAVGPVGQPGAGPIADPVGRVVDVAEEDQAPARKPLLHKIDHPVKPLLEILDPGEGLVERGAEHRPFARRPATVVVDQVVPARSHHHEPENVRVLLFQQLDAFDVLKRRAPGQGDVLYAKVRQHGLKAEPLHLGKLVVRIGREPGHVAVRLCDSEPRGDAVADAQEQHLAIAPRSLKRLVRHRWTGRPFAHRPRQPVMPIGQDPGRQHESQEDQRQQQSPWPAPASAWSNVRCAHLLLQPHRAISSLVPKSCFASSSIGPSYSAPNRVDSPLRQWDDNERL